MLFLLLIHVIFPYAIRWIGVSGCKFRYYFSYEQYFSFSFSCKSILFASFRVIGRVGGGVNALRSASISL